MRIDPQEEFLVRTIHRKVGGPSKLSTYDDPALVRDVVLDALANEQPTAADSARIKRGDLTPLERRVVRTVTNRGAAVRSRMRQRKELQRLREEIAVKDAELLKLRAVYEKCCKHSPAIYMSAAQAKAEFELQPVTVAKVEQQPESESTASALDGSMRFNRGTSDGDESGNSPSSSSSHGAAAGNSCAASSTDSLSGFVQDNGFMSTSLDAQILSNIIDPLS